MRRFDYTFMFGDVGPKMTTVVMTNHRAGTRHAFRVAIDHHNAFKSVRREAADVFLCSDALTLAAVVHVADRMAIREGDEVCRIRIIAPAFRPGLIGSPGVDAHLRDVLRYYTEDEWTFDWTQRARNAQPPAAQVGLPLTPNPEVALWSGGLDSAAGLLSRYLSGSAEAYALVGTGANDCILGVQRQVFHEAFFLRRHHVELIQVPVRIEGNALLPKSAAGRARGFVFALVGGVCAYLQGRDRLHIYENGPGAINLPYCSAELGLDHARSVHPSSLWEVSGLLASLLNLPFLITNPFLFQTKGQMCASLVKIVQWSGRFVFKTVSCDSRHRMPFAPMQCGYCSSCLLRRVALAVNDIEDETPYALWHKQLRPRHAHTLRAMQH